MQLKKLKFTNFRNLDLKYEPGSRFNIILGKNGRGKSNFLDGIQLLSNGKSFKNFNNSDNLNFNSDSDYARIEALLDSDETLNLATIFIKNSERSFSHKYSINDKPTLSSRFLYRLKTILFTPESLELLIGSPDARRSELDDLISVFDKDFAQSVKQYSFVMRSRNRLLVKIKAGYANRDQLTYWNERLINIGSQVVLKRNDYLKEIVPSLSKTSENLFVNFGRGEFNIKYMSPLTTKKSKLEEQFSEKLEGDFSREVAIGRTMFGPHRDDLQFTLSGRNLHVFGSRGEQRLATMIFKIACYEYMTELYGTKIILLLDDILSELDKPNKSRLIEYVEKTEAQIFFTLANKADLPKSIMNESKLLEL